MISNSDKIVKRPLSIICTLPLQDIAHVSMFISSSFLKQESILLGKRKMKKMLAD